MPSRIGFVLEQCKYQTVDPYDSNIEYQCHEDPLDSGDCIFHNENYWTQSQNITSILKRMKEKIDECLTRNIPLECVGYHFPNMAIAEEFSVPVKFLKSTFDNVNFSGSSFIEADFTHAKFNKEAIFLTYYFLGMHHLTVLNFVAMLILRLLNSRARPILPKQNSIPRLHLVALFSKNWLFLIRLHFIPKQT
jgi:uncharacterized protein YjbI with pentapeptide repeats